MTPSQVGTLNKIAVEQKPHSLVDKDVGESVQVKQSLQ